MDSFKWEALCSCHNCPETFIRTHLTLNFFHFDKIQSVGVKCELTNDILFHINILIVQKVNLRPAQVNLVTNDRSHHLETFCGHNFLFTLTGF